MAASPGFAPRAQRRRSPIALPISQGEAWLVGTVLLSLLLYYFVGIDQGAISVFGGDTHIHEFVHDARHFLGFPCH
jgi:Probable cobalt transporter subunit (CbtB)